MCLPSLVLVALPAKDHGAGAFEVQKTRRTGSSYNKGEIRDNLASVNGDVHHIITGNLCTGLGLDLRRGVVGGFLVS